MQSRWKWIPLALMTVFLGGPFQLIGFAEDRDFNRLVKEVESRFNVKRTHVPLLGAARPAIRLMQPGSKSLDMAIFEDQDFSLAKAKDFSELAGKALGPEWHQVVRVVSQPEGEQTFVYLRDAGDHCKLITATLEPREAVLVEVKLKSRDLLRFIDHPEEMGKAENGVEEHENE